MNDNLSWLWVRDTEAADALLNPLTLRYFRVFMNEAIDLHAASARLDMKRTTLRYHVRRFLRWGLLRAVDGDPVRGRTRLRYQAVSRHLYIPFQVSAHASFGDLLLALQQPLFTAFIAQLARAGAAQGADPAAGGVLIQASSVDVTLSAPPHLARQQEVASQTWSSWLALDLTDSEASALKAELTALWQHYLVLHHEPHVTTTPFTLHLGLGAARPSSATG